VPWDRLIVNGSKHAARAVSKAQPRMTQSPAASTRLAATVTVFGLAVAVGSDR
jgi:hypothetical protein